MIATEKFSYSHNQTWSSYKNMNYFDDILYACCILTYRKYIRNEGDVRLKFFIMTIKSQMIYQDL